MLPPMRSGCELVGVRRGSSIMPARENEPDRQTSQPTSRSILTSQLPVIRRSFPNSVHFQGTATKPSISLRGSELPSGRIRAKISVIVFACDVVMG